MGNTTIAIIDDHKIVRQGLKELLEKLGNYTVTYEFENGENFIAALPLEPAPDLYILDFSMPNLNGIQVLKILENKPEEYKVLLLTQHFDEFIIDAAYHHGARGFLNKNCTANDLKFAIDNIVTFGFNNVTEILKRVKQYDQWTNQQAEITIDLAPRDIGFLELICNENELTYDQIAEIMGLSVKTIETIRSTLFERFKIKSKVGLVLFSYRYKLTKPFV